VDWHRIRWRDMDADAWAPVELDRPADVLTVFCTVVCARWFSWSICADIPTLYA
jgi:hypothetical protein